MIILNLTLIFILLSFLFFACIFLMTPLFSKAPFVPVRKKVLSEIILALELKDKSVLYDLGCGDGRILFAADETCSLVSCIGIEKAPFPYIWAKVRRSFSGQKKVLIIRGDMFQADVSSATHIFLYLFPSLMDALLPKFEKELKSGARVVSCDFQFSGRKPDRVLDLKSTPRQLNRKLYIYDF